MTEEVERLRQELCEVYRVLDDIRSHLQWATNNASSLIEQMPRCHITSLARDPCDPEWGSKINGVTRSEVAQLREQVDGSRSRADANDTSIPAPVSGENPVSDAKLSQPAARQHHAPPSNRPRPIESKSEKQPLYMRLVFVPVLTDLVRAVRYDLLTATQLPERLQALQDKYGSERVQAAADEILVKDRVNADLWRLSDEARHFAYQIIGHPPTPPAAGTPNRSVPNVTELTATQSADSPISATTPAVSELREVRLSREKALAQYRAWLTETGQTYHGPSRSQVEALAPQCQTLPDFIVIVDEIRQLVLVSRSPTKPQRADMERWLPVFGTNSEAVAVWPMRDEDGARHWRTQVVATDDQEADES